MFGTERVVRRTHRLSLFDRRRGTPRTGAGLLRRATTTVVGGDRYSTPHSTTLASAAPNAVITRRYSRTSSAARSPLIASIRPPGRSSGKLHRVTLSSAATARDTTASHPPTLWRTAGVLRAAPDHLDVQPEFGDSHAQKLGSAQQRLDQNDAQSGLGDRQRQARQPGAATDIGDSLAGFQQLGDDTAIQ